MTGLIEEQWQTYNRQVVSAIAGDRQRREMRRVFYAGAAALLTTIMRSLDPGSEPTHGDLLRMESIAMELEMFTEDIKEGRA